MNYLTPESLEDLKYQEVEARVERICEMFGVDRDYFEYDNLFGLSMNRADYTVIERDGCYVIPSENFAITIEEFQELKSYVDKVIFSELC